MTELPDPFRPVPPEPLVSRGPSELEGLDPAALLAGANTPVGSAARSGQWEPPAIEELTDLLHGYQITGLLGRGGMGAVYEGEQISLERRVAIKLLPAELGADAEFEARFKREAKSMARLNHPNIVQIYDFGQTAGGHYFFVMEFVDGTDLHCMIRDGQLDVTGALNAISQICDALQYAHDMGFVHRDIKPANIFINRQGLLKVGDFGLAKLVEGSEEAGPHPAELAALTGSGVAMGTLNYIAPEQLTMGATVDRRADIYSLGVMFYEMLTREIPRGAVKEPSKRVALLDVRIDGVVFKAMDPNPEDRYQTAIELRTDVDVIRTTPAPESPASTGEAATSPQTETTPGTSHIRVASPRTSKRNRSGQGAPVRWLFTLMACLVLLSGAWWLWPRDPDAQEREGSHAEVLPALRTPAAKDVPFTNSLGMTFVPIPGTQILMCRHETRKKDYAAYTAKVAGVDNSWTNPKADGVSLPARDDDPVVMVSWNEAKAFCKWLSQAEGKTYRLPTDREWSLAAQTASLEPEGMAPEELSRLGWGGPNDGFGNFADVSWQRTLPNRSGGSSQDDTFPTTAPVMSFAPNGLGLYDLKGNVWEMCEDYYNASQEFRAARGNSWNDTNAFWSNRASRGEDTRSAADGFRCVLVLAETPAKVAPVIPFRPEGPPRRFGLSRYQVILGPASWAEARSEAVKRGGHLATLNSPDEVRRLLQPFSSAIPESGEPIWLGGNGMSVDSPKDWFWVTGQAWGHPDWPSAKSAEGVEKAPYYFAGLTRSPGNTSQMATIPATKDKGAGFLIEWEDITGSPALTSIGEKPTTPFTNSLGMKFLPVPGADILLCAHETRKADFAAYAAQNRTLPPAWKQASREGIPVSTGDDHPVVNMTWYEARDFCEWLGRKEGRTYRLPTDREWSLAAGLGDFESTEGLPLELGIRLSAMSLYPWAVNLDNGRVDSGNFLDRSFEKAFPKGPKNNAWKIDDGFASTAPVMRFKPNPLGFYDLHGNVWDLCEDATGPGMEVGGIKGIASNYRILRGGMWSSIPRPLTERGRTGPTQRFNDIGFRIALVLPRVPSDEPPRSLAERTHPVGQPQRFGSSRYQYVEGAVTWGEARVRAEQMGGHLATLSLAPEADWVEREYRQVLKQAGSSLWLGLLFHSGRRWINGEVYRHGQWEGEPDLALYSSSAFQNHIGGVLTSIDPGKIVLHHRPLDGSGATAPGGFLVEWDDLEGMPLPKATVTTTDEPFTNSLGMRFVSVKGSGILLCAHETRRQDYAAFASESLLDDGWKKPHWEDLEVGGSDDHPVVMVNWYEARAFCDWLSRREGRTYRLPTDREWSQAVGIAVFEPEGESLVSLGKKRRGEMAWGTDWPPPAGSGNFADESFGTKGRSRAYITRYQDGFVTTAPVKSFPANLQGFYDLDGNVSEWIEDPHPTYLRERLLRGSHWSDSEALELSRRRPEYASYRRSNYGFRCAVVVEQGQSGSPEVVSTSRANAAQTTVGTVSGSPPAVPVEQPPFFLGRWYQTFDGKAAPVYLTEFLADGQVSATTPEGRRSAGRWQVSGPQLHIVWENGVSHRLTLPGSGRIDELKGEAGREGKSLGSTVSLSRVTPDPARSTVTVSDEAEASNWTVIGDGKLVLKDGAMHLVKGGDKSGIAWYTKRKYGNFILTTGFRVANSSANSGIHVRATNPNGSATVADRGYQIDLSGTPVGKEATGAICLIQAPTSVPQRVGWNELEIEVRGRRHLIRVNGIQVNDFNGDATGEGYIGLQIYKPDGIEYRDMRIRALP